MDAVDRTSLRQGLKVQGQVQGVGFRPWVRQQALALALTGWVRNTHDGVVVALQGPPEAIQAFKQRLHEASPGSIARIEPYDLPAGLDTADSIDLAASSGFSILPSLSAGTPQRCIPPDTAVCEECLKELFEPTSRRWRHPFIHCTQCGPRFTTLTGWPFDRAHTTMAHFEPCPQCRQEYAATHDRRSHDQTICCPHCGPRLQLFSDRTDASSHHPQGSAADPIQEVYRRLKQGQILAIQGTGGFHLCCDAQQADAVAKLRRVKQRPHQPFAMMCANLASAHRWAHINQPEAHWLQHPGRPIVLLTAKPDTLVLKGIAPGLTHVGMMLPTSPIQYLLFHEAADQAQGTAWLNEAQDLALVMTSGNVHGAPLIKDPEEAMRAFAGMADAILWHDQAIAHRADDSVMRVRSDGSACWLRKSRGWVPQPLTGTATTDAPHHILALGGDLKHTQCEWMSDGEQWHAWVGPHIGHLQNPEARALAWSTAQQNRQGAHEPPLDIIVSDLHPDYASHHMGATLASQMGAQHVCVPHHVAHVAAVLAEQAAAPDQAVLAWVVDGQGWGTDGQAWGGELLWMRGREWQRLGHLQPLALPGGDRAAKEPWRMAAAALHACGLGDQIPQRWPDEAHSRSLQQWLNSGAVPHTTSLGRLFDAVAGLLGLLTHSTFEAHAAMWLEAAAHGASHHANQVADRFEDPVVTTASDLTPAKLGHSTTPLVLDWRPWFRTAAQQPCLTPVAQAHMAAAFHEYISVSMAALALQAAQQHQVDTVVLTGGCMANRLSDERVTSLIQAKGLKVWRAAQYPCGDGGLSLGQAWYAHLPHTNSAPMKA